MKKLLLLMMAAVVSMTTMARQLGIAPAAKATGVGINLPKLVNNGAVKSVAERNAALNAFYSAKQQRAQNAIKASKRAEEVSEEDLIPTYSMDNYIYTNVTGAMFMPMYEGASYAIKDNKVYFTPFEGLDCIEGELIEGCDMFENADSITFTLSTQKEVGQDKAGTKYYIGLATFDMESKELKRNDKMTLGAYYFPENGEIYVPLFSLDDFVCLFAENATDPEFGYSIANLDIMPQDYLNEYMFYGRYTASDALSEDVVPERYFGKVKAFINGSSIFVKGINSSFGLIEDAWVEFETDEEFTNAIVSDEQLLGFAELYTDDTYTTTAQLALTPVGALSDLTGLTSDYTSSYFLEINEEENKLIIASTGMDIYGVYALSQNKDFNGGVIWMSDLQISLNLVPGEEIEEMYILTSPEGYATFFDSQSDYTLPEGLTAQTVTGVANGKLTFKTLTDGIVPKNTAVLLSGDTGNEVYTLTASDAEAAYTGTNLLHGSDEATMTTADNNCYFYKLTYGAKGSNLENLFGWYWGAANGGAFQIGAHKAWLAVPMSAGARYFINNDTDGIIAIEKTSTNNDIVFDLQGRRMNTMLKKGLYIKNGKKIVNM